MSSLFAAGDLDVALSAALDKARRRLADWDPDALLKASEHDVIETLVDEASVRCPQLLRDQVEMLEPEEVARQFTQFGEQYKQRVTVLTLVVPYEGERLVFRTRASHWQMATIEATLLTDAELRLTVEGVITDGRRSANDSKNRWTASPCTWTGPVLTLSATTRWSAALSPAW